MCSWQQQFEVIVSRLVEYRRQSGFAFVNSANVRQELSSPTFSDTSLADIAELLEKISA